MTGEEALDAVLAALAEDLAHVRAINARHQKGTP